MATANNWQNVSSVFLGFWAAKLDLLRNPELILFNFLLMKGQS